MVHKLSTDHFWITTLETPPSVHFLTFGSKLIRITGPIPPSPPTVLWMQPLLIRHVQWYRGYHTFFRRGDIGTRTQA